MLNQLTLSIQRPAHEFLIPLICSVLSHILFLSILANYISNYRSTKQTLGKEVLTVNLKSTPNVNSTSTTVSSAKTSKPLLSKSVTKEYGSNSPMPEMDISHPILVVPDSPYYTIKELERIPSILKNVNSDPPELLQFSQGGELAVRIWIDENGNVVNTEIVKSNLPEEFNLSALKNFANAKFSPGIKNNFPVKTVVNITVRYASKEPVKE